MWHTITKTDVESFCERQAQAFLSAIRIDLNQKQFNFLNNNKTTTAEQSKLLNEKNQKSGKILAKRIEPLAATYCTQSHAIVSILVSYSSKKQVIILLKKKVMI